jgi:hypothetical protein
MTERMERAVKPSSGVENETHAIPDKVDNTLINIDFFTVSPALFSANENHCKAWRDSAKTATNMNVQAVTSLDEFLHFPGATWNCTRFVLDPLTGPNSVSVSVWRSSAFYHLQTHLMVSAETLLSELHV